MKGEKTLFFRNVKPLSHIPMYVTISPVSIGIIKSFFDENGYNMMKKRIERRGKCSFECSVCLGELSGLFAIGCDSCLEWFCRSCVGLKNEPKKATWFCPGCEKG